MKCKFCGYTTSIKSAMVDHMRNSHKGKIDESSNSYYDFNFSLISSFVDDSSSYSSFDSSSYSSYDSSSSSDYSGGGGDFGGGGASSDW